MSLDDADIPDSLRRIIVRNQDRFDNRAPLAAETSPRCTLSFVWERADGHWVTLADLWADGPIPIPAIGEVVQLHEEYVRVLDVRTQYDLTEDGPVKGRVEVFTIVFVEPATAPLKEKLVTDSSNTVEACGCGGYRVITPVRPGIDPKTVHHNAGGNEAPCPNDR